MSNTDNHHDGQHAPSEQSTSRRSTWLVAAAVLLALGLGFSNLGTPSIWHDEAYHVFVAKSILQTGRPLLLDGEICASAPLYNTVLAGVIGLFGDAETVVRAPSVLFAALNVLLIFLIIRPLLGQTTALVTAFALALSPWSVAWSREAKLYSMQQTAYLLTMVLAWRMMANPKQKLPVWPIVGGIMAYLCGLLCSLHSVLFVAPIGIYAFLNAACERRLKSRWTGIVAVIGMVGLLTMMGYAFFLPRGDTLAIFKDAGLGTKIRGTVRPDRWLYLTWLKDNLSVGFLLLALFGSVVMPVRNGWRGLFAVLAFWAPVLVLTFFLDYRRPRFIYFVFPFYVAAFSYALVVLLPFTVRLCRRAKQGWTTAEGRFMLTIAILLILFLGRLAISGVSLIGDSLDVARGAHTTLARRHPQWRAPCQYVREHMDEETAVLSTTYLPVLHYVGRINDWYPSRFIIWESHEANSLGLRNVSELEKFIAKHPKGYFLAEWWRFDTVPVFPELKPDNEWVKANMTLIEAGTSEDVALYAWGMDASETDKTIGTEAP